MCSIENKAIKVLKFANGVYLQVAIAAAIILVNALIKQQQSSIKRKFFNWALRI